MKNFVLSLLILSSSGYATGMVPENYQALKACAKQEVLWNKVQESAYKDLPEYRSFGFFQLMAMSFQEIALKGTHDSDFAPTDWKKYIHGRSSVAKVKIIPVTQKYTGIFQGAECALLRLSLTYKPEGSRPVAPGLALKVLRDHVPSANVSALVSLAGQEKDFNFFKHSMSNIVPMSSGFGQRLVHKIFSKVSSHPEELSVDDMAAVDVKGVQSVRILSPRHLFFTPALTLSVATEEHDVRNDFAKIPVGTVIYKLFAVPEKYARYDYANYSLKESEQFLKESEHIADIVTASSFVSSEFGDDGIFFRHQLRKN